MIEEEQQAYINNPERRGYELNKAVALVQRLIRNRAQ